MPLFFSLGCPEPIVYQQDSIQPPDIKHMVKIVDEEHRQGGFWIDAFNIQTFQINVRDQM